jgi:hypothetical protein
MGRDALPSKFSVVTGWGRHSKVKGNSDVKEAVVEHLKTHGSPFELTNPGLLEADGPAVQAWLGAMQRDVKERAALAAKLAALTK